MFYMNKAVRKEKKAAKLEIIFENTFKNPAFPNNKFHTK